MGRVLGRNDDIFTFHEIHFFEQLWSPSEKKIEVSIHQANDLFAKLLCIEREGYLSGCEGYEKYLPEVQPLITSSMSKDNVFEQFLNYEATQHNKYIPCDQTPRNLFYCKEILELYPDAKIIYMVRDPRDVLLSQKNKWKRRSLGAKAIPLSEAVRTWVNYHPITVSKLWNASVNSMKSLENHPSVTKVYFEDLLHKPDAMIKNICTFIGVTYSKDMLNVPQVGSSIGVDNPKSTGIDQNRTLGYNNGGLSLTELSICENIVAKNMNHHGYSRNGYSVNPIKLIGYYMTFPLKIALALVLNLRRMKNIVETIKRRMK